ncbi:MAG: tetratricopeptide repeat protein [Burkholderiales bacterium]|nr:tetratricopeptide repeat protein [Burkholderiales bacterium]
MRLLGRLRDAFPGRRARAHQAELEAALALHEQGRIDAADAIYRRILAAAPDHAQALHLAGLAAHQRGDDAAAVALIERAIVRDGTVGLCHLNLGNALRALGRGEEALASYARATERDPGRFAAWFNFGQLARERGRADAAVAAFRRALALDPASDDAAFGLAMALIERRTEGDERTASAAEAVALLESRWTRAPDQTEMRYVLARALEACGRWTEAAAHLEAVAQARPGLAEVRNRLANCYNRLGRAAEAVREYRETFRLDPVFHHALSSVLGALNSVADATPEAILDAHREWARLIAAPLYPAAPRFANVRDPARRLRVGYVSPDLRRHPVGTLFAPVLDRHDAGAFETFCYYNFARSDAVTERMRGAAHCWRDVAALDDAALAEHVRTDGIDILVDLAGHTTHTRLPAFARRPAPVQVSWLGYFNTTGVATIDWFVTDPHSSPPGQERYFVEKLVRLPATRFCYEPPEFMPEVSPLPARRNGFVTFGCFNNLAKLNPGVLKLWARILAALPDARLALQASALSDTPNRERFRALARECGIPDDRLALRPFAPAEQAAAAYHDIDIALDPFPFCGGMTSLDALWMGVPVVTLPHVMIAGRQTASMLANLDLSELIAGDEAQYVDIAVGLARDLDRLAGLRAGLRERFRRSPLADYAGFTRALERAYRMIWEMWVAST